MQIILHIGQQKTASTFIQAHLAQNRDRLAAQGVLYPTAFGEWKARYIKQFLINGPKLRVPRETMAANMRAEFSGNHTKVILSDENFYPWEDNDNKKLLKRTLEEYATSWRVLCYVRRPDEHLASNYQQKVKVQDGFSGTLDDYAAKMARSNYYRYALQIKRWAEVFGEDAVEVRVFHRKTLQGSPIEDFVRWIGVNPETLSFDPVEQKRVNESYDRVGTEVLRLLRRYQAKHPELLTNRMMTRVRRGLLAVNVGERLRLDTDKAKWLNDRFREDHELLAKHYLSPEHAAVLLAPPAEASPQPPIDSKALLERMMTIFPEDPEFARLVPELKMAEEQAKVGPADYSRA